MLIKNAWVNGAPADLRLSNTVDAIAPALNAQSGEAVLDVAGGQVLPGLHDHHIHLFASAAAYGSVSCNVGDGTPAHCRQVLAERLAQQPGGGWIRGVDYHEQQLGELDRWALDDLCDDRPLRIQHRSGKVWVCNSMALDLLGFNNSADVDVVELDSQGQVTGCIVRGDRLMAERLKASGVTEAPDIEGFSRQLARLGVVAVTDTSASNNTETVADFQGLQSSGKLLQRVTLMGDDTLQEGYLKVLLDEDSLPPLLSLVQRINTARARGRHIAFHCVTHLELVFALAALADALPPSQGGFDRIEHGAVVTDEMAQRLGDLGMPVVSQPGFLYTKGDQYRQDLRGAELANLYRYAGLRAHGVSVVASSDAPYGPVSPWQVIETAALRQTHSGSVIGGSECVSATEALSGYLTEPHAIDDVRPFRESSKVNVGMRADLCVLTGKWADEGCVGEGVEVRATFIDGSLVFDASASPADQERAWR